MLTYSELRSLAEAVTANPHWPGPAVEVSRLVAAGDAHGKTTGRVVRFPHRAPACTVPHELAHVLRWPDVDHDRAWAVEYLRLGLITRDAITSTLAGRGRPSARTPTAPP